jgi:hypothetical protein
LGFARAETIRKLIGSFLPLDTIVNRSSKKKKKEKKEREREREKKPKESEKKKDTRMFEKSCCHSCYIDNDSYWLCQ